MICRRFFPATRTREKRRKYRDTGRGENGVFSCYVSSVEQLGVLEAREGKAHPMYSRKARISEIGMELRIWAMIPRTYRPYPHDK